MKNTWIPKNNLLYINNDPGTPLLGSVSSFLGAYPAYLLFAMSILYYSYINIKLFWKLCYCLIICLLYRLSLYMIE